MNPWRLFAVAGPESGKTIHLVKQIWIGRESENDVCIPDGQVSRCHAHIEPTDNGYQVTDMGSTNGTFINDKRIDQTAPLHIGDSITIGPARFLVLADSTGNLGE